MNLTNACANILSQLSDLISNLQEPEFTKPVNALSNSTLGQHLRHTLEFFICLEQGYHQGVVNYDKRAHDKLIETDKFIAQLAIQRISDFVRQAHDDKPMKLEVGYDIHADDVCAIDTNFLRELTYNIEHAVHHMAIMKIGVREVAPHIALPPDFGIAASTIRYKESVTASH
jgi:hypothetical protein